ncbi:phospholipid transport system substrate-binding protein [Mariprofundus ferrinatatus]|uniref:Phospholipid transport system substrate-binding protein n=1 Tax=Mariprofundus ferrinatatus TaxID=1921087 RepID=A0A2K8LEX0_9PROT|nr:ABC transporter substrate-binding protein [Mariprofundus ferrinatatus]ATX82816.1 phospholipid transport system substrate-binding protein [Mariprofundus ferrinatatus]
MMKLFRTTFAILLTMLVSTTAWAADSDPKVVIETTVNQIIQVLEAREDTTKLTTKDRDAIRQTVEGRFDYAAMARRSLGKPWNDLHGEQQAHFTQVFRDLLERSYGNRLSEYKGQKVVFAEAELKNDKARVESTVIDGTRETPVEYRLHQTKTGWQVYDIRIEGTSMVRTFYQDFQATLDNGGYEHLLKTLEEKVAELKAKDQD